ncbi:hypothetical protein J6590_034113 [Homalodisca vitripennis]|nr:hypothetical protein J6590_034113 [Homalodisca vitripennis]
MDTIRSSWTNISIIYATSLAIQQYCPSSHNKCSMPPVTILFSHQFRTVMTSAASDQSVCYHGVTSQPNETTTCVKINAVVNSPSYETSPALIALRS